MDAPLFLSNYNRLVADAGTSDFGLEAGTAENIFQLFS